VLASVFGRIEELLESQAAAVPPRTAAADRAGVR
jgi:hypothetical protein